jgi:CheY-like chemotaxis protein
VKIVALSASVFKEDREQVLAAGADDFVFKPIQFGRIFDCMTKHLGVQYISDELLTSAAKEPSMDLDRAALAALPSVLRMELADALVSLDAAPIAELISRVSEQDPTLGGVLEHHAGQFQYTVILRALESCRNDVSNDEGKV